MGRQHAEQVGPVCRVGMPLFYSGLMARILNQAPADFSDRVARASLKKLLDPLLVNRLLRQVPAGSLECLAGMAEGAGLNRRELEIALVLPDLLPTATGLLAHLFPTRFVEGVPGVRLGCSSFVSASDPFLIARNLDFPGVGYWDRYPVIQQSTPDSGLRSISFTSAGVALGGITGINEAQVFVAIHQHYSHTLSLTGQLPFVIGEKILRTASSLDDALAILEKSKLASSWAFILADGKTRQAAVWEATPKVHGLRRLKPGAATLTHSNFFQTPQCQPTEYAMSERMNWDNYWRKTRLDQLLKAADGNVTPAVAARAISDHLDPFWGEEKIVNRIVSQAFNIQSLVVDPVSMQAWLASGNSPIHLRDFKRFDLGEVFAGRTGATAESVPGYRFQDTSKANAKNEFILSLISALDGDESAALLKLKASLDHHFTPEVALTAAVVSMRQGELDQAERWLDKATDAIQAKLKTRPGTPAPPEYFEMRLYQGRLADLQGKHVQAKAHYRFVAQAPDLKDVNLKRLARARKPYSRKKLAQLLLPYSTYAPFN